MNSESKDILNPSLVMVPSMNSATGWKYIQSSKLDSIREHRTNLLPGLHNKIKKEKKLNQLNESEEAKTNRNLRPDAMFPDTKNEHIITGGLLQDKLTGL